jgi:predicted TIM-barrel fold metal-dependent hydrolase
MIVDMQVHLWEAETPERPHLKVRAFRTEPYTAEEMLPRMEAADVDRVVIVPPMLMGYDNRYALECAMKWPDKFHVMGRFDPVAPDFKEKLAGWLQQPGMLGIRLPFHANERARWPHERAAEPFFAEAERLKIPVALFASDSLSYVEPVARNYPGLTIIVDHLGLPLIEPGEENKHRELDKLVELAKYPNVSTKVSAIALHSKEKYPYGDMHPIVKAAYEAFGPDRLMWGSDWTQTLTFDIGTYNQDVDWLRLGCDFIPEADRAKILGENAGRIVNWPA